MIRWVGVITLGILVVVFLFLIRLTKWRYKQAFAMGRWEHAAGRLLGGAILLTCFLAWAHKDVFFLTVVDFLIWVIYLCSHTIEKWLYPKHQSKD
jgi:hypothetical protein